MYLENFFHKILFIVLIVLITNSVHACNKGSVSLDNTVCNLDGTVTYTFTMCLQYYGLEGNPEEFNFTFTGASIVSANPTTVTTDSNEDYNLDNAGIGTSTIQWDGAWLIGNAGNDTKCWTITITTDQAATSFTNTRHHNTGYDCGQNTPINIAPCPVPCDPTWTPPAALCFDDASINLNTLVTGDAGGTWSGTGVTGNTFDPTGLDGTYSITYTLADCDESHDITVSLPDASWTPQNVCALDGFISLSNLVTGDGGGTWSGTGVSSSNFFPNGLSGNISISYSINENGCTDQSTQNIFVESVTDATWNTTTICESDGILDLTTLEAGTNGGTWSGTGVTGNNFDPTSLNGNISLTYSVGTGTCNEILTQNIVVNSGVTATWNTTSMCDSDPTLNLNTLITGNTGGTWSGTGVTGNNFNPLGLNGNISITYSVGSGSCMDALTQNISVTSNPDATWNTTTICESDGPLDLTTLEVGTNGGTWSGTGVTGSNFDPTGQSGNVSLTYTVGGGSCNDQLSQNIVVDATVDPNWNTITICAGDGTLDLTTLETGTNGGAWNGSGVTGITLDPASLSGSITLTYVVNNGSCAAQLAQNISIDAAVDASWNSTTICSSSGILDLTTLIAGSSGGSWGGIGVTGSNFDPSGQSGNISLTYSVTNGLCNDLLNQTIAVTNNPDASWTTTALCEGDPNIDLNTLITGGSGGSWNGLNVSGNNFTVTSPGSYAVEYVIGNAICGDSSTQNIIVNNQANPFWNYSKDLCDDDTPIDLNNSVSGDVGGTWSGSGITGSTFDPSGLNGIYSLQYVANNAFNCPDSFSRNITVIARPSSDWRDTTVCAGSRSFNLNNLLDVATSSFGTWGGGNYIQNSTFNPVNESGLTAVTYTVGGTCFSSTPHNIMVDPMPDPSWNDTTLCVTDAAFDLNILLSGTPGGIWSGTPVLTPNFDPTGLTGAYSIKYLASSGLCKDSLIKDISIDAMPNPSWNTTTICEDNGLLDLNALITTGTSGIWSGIGVTGNNFDPTGLEGNTTIDYSVTVSSCTANLSQDIIIDTLPTSTSFDTTICETSGPLAINILVRDGNIPNWIGTNTTNNQFDPSGNLGDHIITYSLVNGTCTDNFNSTITVSPPPIADWTAPTNLINNKDQAFSLLPFLSESSQTDGVWEGTNITNAGIFDPSGLKGDYEITYTVGVDGCGDQQSDVIKVIADFGIYFYNAFSPNGDDMNDEFSPIGNFDMVEDYQFTIYNRWGEKIFETTDTQEKWLGYVNNDLSMKSIQGTYAYRVKFVDMKGDKYQYDGMLMLLQ